jgi:hypothetical protein
MNAAARSVVADVLERAGWTAGQQFLAVLLATDAASTGVDLPWTLALAMSAGAALLSIVATTLQYLARLTDLSFWRDLQVRLAKTFLASLAGSFAAEAFNVLSFDWSGALDLATVATLGALAKCLLARESASSDATPSTLPTSTYERAIKVGGRGMPDQPSSS